MAHTRRKLTKTKNALKIYISGPITGIANDNREAFSATASILVERGYRVINPHDLTPERLPGEKPEDFYERCMAIDLEALRGCQGVFLLPGWESSKGSCRELLRALELGKKVMH